MQPEFLTRLVSPSPAEGLLVSNLEPKAKAG